MNSTLTHTIKNQLKTHPFPSTQSSPTPISQITYPDGTIYHGQLQNNIPWGTGSLTFPSGNQYKGQFSNGCQEGFGEFHYKSIGEKYYGQWRAGVKHGQGEYRFKDGSVFKGSFKGDVKHGPGKKVSRNLAYSGVWKEGRKEGVFRFKKLDTGEESLVEYKRNKVVRVRKLKRSRRKYPEKKLKKSYSSEMINKKVKKNNQIKKLNILKKTQNKNIPSKSLNKISSEDLPSVNPSPQQISGKRLWKSLDPSAFLQKIDEESETCVSVISIEPKKQLLFEIQSKSNCSKSGVFDIFSKAKSGVNLLSDRSISSSCFRFQGELEFEKFGKEVQLKCQEFNDNTEDDDVLRRGGTGGQFGQERV